MWQRPAQRIGLLAAVLLEANGALSCCSPRKLAGIPGRGRYLGQGPGPRSPENAAGLEVRGRCRLGRHTLGLWELAEDKILRVFPVSILASEPKRRKPGSKVESGLGYSEGTKKDLLGRVMSVDLPREGGKAGAPKTLKDARLPVEKRLGDTILGRGLRAIPL